MTNTGQACDKRMLTFPTAQSTKGGCHNLIPLNSFPLNFSGPKNFQEIPDADLHDEDLYTYKILRGAISGKSQQAVTHV